MTTRVFGLAVALVGACFSAAWGGPSGKTAANVMVELSFTDAKERADPFNEVTLDAIFTEPTVAAATDKGRTPTTHQPWVSRPAYARPAGRSGLEA